MLDQLHTTTNIQNGAPSRVLDTLAVSSLSFREIVSIVREFPSNKLLSSGRVPNLKVYICDDNNKTIDNNEQSISVVQ